MMQVIILLCAASIAHADCAAANALDVIRGPQVESSLSCGLGGQTVLARSDMLAGGGVYQKIVCERTK